MNARNQIRNLAEVVTLEAWHEGFSVATPSADLNVNVAFSAGRIGGKPGDKIRFRLTLKQAEVVVIVPQTEPAKIDPRTVRRESRRRIGTSTETHESTREGCVDAGARIKAGPSEIDAGLDLGGKASLASKKQTVVSLTEELQDLAIEHGTDEEGRHRWVIRPAIGDELVGRPWRDEDQVRLAVLDTRPDRARGLPPSVRVEVRCRREDLVISNIVLSDEGLMPLLKRKGQHRNREVAAEAFLRNRLFEEGLLQGGEGDLRDPFATMTLAAITAEGL